MSKGSHRPRRHRGAGTSFSVANWGLDKDEPNKGPWFIASRPGDLSCCGDECEEGDEIRADGEGGYEGRCCFPEEGK